MSESVLLVEKKDRIATVTMNRPKKMNAMNKEMQRSLRDSFVELGKDPDTDVVILTGAGKAFTAGIDLKELGETGGFATGERGVTGQGSPFYAMEHFEKPIIGAINGASITGGFELALACDIMIASTNAVFADTHARVGILPGAGLSQKLSRAIGIYRAKEVSLTGNFISAETACDWGLVNRVVEPDELMPACYALAEDIISCQQDIVRKHKALINDGFGKSFSAGMALEAEVFAETRKASTGETVEAARQAVIDRGRKQAEAKN